MCVQKVANDKAVSGLTFPEYWHADKPKRLVYADNSYIDPLQKKDNGLYKEKTII